MALLTFSPVMPSRVQKTRKDRSLLRWDLGVPLSADNKHVAGHFQSFDKSIIGPGNHFQPIADTIDRLAVKRIDIV